MSESDGLQKLTAYLNQTRRQAEAAVDALNVQISQLKDENETYAMLCSKVEEEKEHYRSQVEQMKQETTTKHRLQERDDWRSLIDSVQKDRARLQEECNALETTLELAKEEIAELQDELEKIANERQEADDGTTSIENLSPAGRNQRRPSSLLNSELSEDTPFPALASPVIDRNGNEVSIGNFETPRSLAVQLKLELKKAHAQLAAERQQAEENQLAYRLEISRLTKELDAVRPQITGESQPAGRGNGRAHAHAGMPTSASGQHEGVMVLHRPTRTIEWLNPLGYIGYWFSGGNTSSNSAHEKNTVVIQV